MCACVCVCVRCIVGPVLAAAHASLSEDWSTWTVHDVQISTNGTMTPTMPYATNHIAKASFSAAVDSPTMFYARALVQYDPSVFATKFRLGFLDNFFVAGNSHRYVDVDMEFQTTTLGTGHTPGSGATMQQVVTAAGNTYFNVTYVQDAQ